MTKWNCLDIHKTIHITLNASQMPEEKKQKATKTCQATPKHPKDISKHDSCTLNTPYRPTCFQSLQKPHHHPHTTSYLSSSQHKSQCAHLNTFSLLFILFLLSKQQISLFKLRVESIWINLLGDWSKWMFEKWNLTTFPVKPQNKIPKSILKPISMPSPH